MTRLNSLFQILLNYSGWFACIKLASHEETLIATFVIFSIAFLQFLSLLLIRKKNHGLLSLVIIFFMIGFFFDSMLVYQSLIVFHANPFAPWISPPWMWGIWLSFSLLFYSTMMSLFDHQFLLMFLMFLGFSVSYFIGTTLGAATFPLGYVTNLPAFAFLSGVLLLGLHLQQWIIYADD